ncbi:extracellular catalytic domain type 1 short-chain-length polyhydroxyalkanoate depolymerase [Polaromonas eurypsychrophila]|uniref:Esterase n=1 Tax=Polaromonas eurypsychrophila TaxID=1614635 RepID=A0A916SHF7_9BURK|nr:PHB depolymerase family esterase [Polaromonas eurypsychrophila]GGB00241.1 esterase [Polaromonas eurypsychrophila]
MNNVLQDLMREATRLTQSGRLAEATEAIQRALGGAVPAARPRPGARAGAATPAESEADPLILDGCVFEVDEQPSAAAAKAAPVPEPAPSRGPAAQGQFISGTFTEASRTRRYKLFVPPGRAGRQLPLVVMLHGCTQNPDDFAAGTGMNAPASTQGFFVLYPEQSQDANPQRCWNWFKHNHQQRGSGEPALIAGMTQAVMKDYGIDPRRVYIAGLSAGGAMAAVVAGAYPEMFAAAGVHSGLPSGAASNLPEALALMNSGAAGPSLQSGGRFGAAVRMKAPPPVPVPTIVFHGDADRTVHPRNGEQVLAAALGDAARGPQVEQGMSPNGRRYTRSTHLDGEGKSLAEHWRVEGAGHAWSGGDASGSYTDARGPDATREMLRFFFEHPLAPRH